MRDIFAFVPGRDFAELDQLVSLGVKCGRINQRCANTQSARFHFLPNELAHLVHFLGRWYSIIKSNHVSANGRRAEKRRGIAGNPAFLQVLQIFCKRVPFDLVFDVGLVLQHVLAESIVYWAHRFAFAHDFGGHALANLALRSAILNERFRRPRKHIDKAGGHGETPRVDRGFGGGIRQIAYAGNAIAADGDICDPSLGTGAVIKRPALNNNVERRIG